MANLQKGDIVRNIFAGNNNPNAHLLYLGKGSCWQGRHKHKIYNCVNYEGEKVQIFRENEPLVVVGHMKEFDNFISALQKLKDMGDDYDG